MPGLTTSKCGRARGGFAVAVSLALGGCASTVHVNAFQEAAIAAPRTLTLDSDTPLPFAIPSDAVARAAARAGFVTGGNRPARYHLVLAAAAGSTGAGSFLPGGDGTSRSWVARPDHGMRARFGGGEMLRITAVLVDSTVNREVWRGTGTLRTAEPAEAAPGLVEDILAKLPRGDG